MGERDSGVVRQPLLFMVHGVDQPYNARDDRSKIARHLSKRYHRQKRKPLYATAPEPQTNVVQYAVPYHHGGERLAVTPQAPPSKKRKLAVKIEDTDEPVLSLIRPEEEGSEMKIKESKVSKACCECKHATTRQTPEVLNRDGMIATKRSPAYTHDMIPRNKQMSQCTEPLIRLPTNGGWRGEPLQSLPIHSDGCVPLIIDYCKEARFLNLTSTDISNSLASMGTRI